MNAVRNKLKSQRGASITYALLVFLVCAVVSSIVIVAGSAAAGRMADVPRSDRRYYAVTSAAELLKSQIDGRTVVVTDRITETTEEGVTKQVHSYTEQCVDDAAATTDNNILVNATRRLVEGAGQSATYALTTENYPEALNCSIDERLENGLLVYTVSSAGDNPYVLRMRFASNMKESSRQIGTGVTQTTTTVKWKFHSMQKVVSKPAATEGP